MTQIRKYKTDHLSVEERFEIFHVAMWTFKEYRIEEVDYHTHERVPLKQYVAWLMDNFPAKNDTLQVSLLDEGDHVVEVIWRRVLPHSKELFITFIIDPLNAAKILSRLKSL